MSRLCDSRIEERFRAFVEELARVIGHADRAGPFRHYCAGLLLPAERKSVEPIGKIPTDGSRLIPRISDPRAVSGANFVAAAI